MKKCITAILSMVVYSSALHAMEEYALVPLHEKTLATVAKKFDKAASELEVLCCGRQREKVELLKEEYVELSKEIPSQTLVWPENNKDYSACAVQWSNKGLQTLRALHDSNLVTVFATVPSHIECSFLKKINVSHNNLPEIPLKGIIDACPNLTHLDASHNNITYVAVSGPNFIDSKRTKALKSLNLSHNKITKIDVGTLMEKCPSAFLDLSSNPLQLVTWRTECNLGGLPRIDMRNTNMLQEQKDAFIKAYTVFAQRDIRRNIVRLALLAGNGVALITSYPIVYAVKQMDNATKDEQFGIGLGALTSVATVASGMAYWITCLCNRSVLQQKAEEARANLIFDDNNVDMSV